MDYEGLCIIIKKIKIKRPLYSTNWQQTQLLTYMFLFFLVTNFWHISNSIQLRKRIFSKHQFSSGVLDNFHMNKTWIMPLTKNVGTTRIYSINKHLLSAAPRKALPLVLYKCKKEAVVLLSPASSSKITLCTFSNHLEILY